MKWLLSFLLVVISFSANADYLIVTRPANLRQAPNTSSEVMEKLKAGDTLTLSDEAQTNGYYHVVSVSSGQQGWVYRNLVRKAAGELPPGLAKVADNGTLVDVRVVDVGAGLCNLIKLPGNKYVIYDVGGDYNTNGDRTYGQIKGYIDSGSTIELLVLSHTDADHIVAAKQVIMNYNVKKVLWGGYEGAMISGASTAAYRRLIEALDNRPNTENINLHDLDSTIAPGTGFSIGSARFTFLCGFGRPLPEWGLDDRGEMLNAVSIVMKLEFGGNSILFCGDAVGRHRDDPESALIATEKYMVDHAGDLLKSTIVIAPHHGAKNGSSKAFVEHTKPEYVVFSAGHKNSHPTTRTANQYLRFTDESKMFRTDRGDDEGNTEWKYLRVNSCSDKYGDDDVQIQLRSNGTYRAYYLNPEGSCIQ